MKRSINQNQALFETCQWLRQQYWDEEKSISEIAKILGVGRSTVWRWLKKFDIKRRGSSGNKAGEEMAEETKKKIQATMQEYHENNPGVREGKNHGCWKGGGITYHQTKARKTWGKHYDYKIPKGFLIHHIDRDVTNNDMGNLVLLNRSLHVKIHNWEREARDAYGGYREDG